MKITITATGESPVVLGDDTTGDYITGALPEQRRQGQANTGLRKASADTLDRKNRQNTITFQVDRKHDSVEDAWKFVLRHAEFDVPNAGLVEFTHNDGFAVFMPAAFVSRVQCVQHLGVRTVFSYTLEAGEIVDALTS